MVLRKSKKEYSDKLYNNLEKFDKALLVNCDNVRSQQFQDIRRSLRGNTILLMGKNTLIRKCIMGYQEQRGEETGKWDCLMESLKGNIGIVFTEADLAEVHTKIHKFKVGAPARVGAIAPCDVTIPAGNTGMDPSATTFFSIFEYSY
eukprot:gnl/TRDRNA2_/TRDRNA2_178019_c3_seq1.p1 gnl/TRDRNA2_/TRDRNA2_178019_c3~~gnl/TRDRNA2_/TRDRNA2_178019_c3_seq1.p1  ORF type:complete len:147 (+),score=1.16 gnl/TRDRNA2_/TRDRNA2_178019_c3_seq1:309-749(+)